MCDLVLENQVSLVNLRILHVVRKDRNISSLRRAIWIRGVHEGKQWPVQAVHGVEITCAIAVTALSVRDAGVGNRRRNG